MPAKAAASTSYHHSNCYDQREATVCARERKHERCNQPNNRRYCALTCGTCAHLMLPIQVAWLHGGYLPIPEDAGPIFLEIGASDRNTMDT